MYIVRQKEQIMVKNGIVSNWDSYLQSSTILSASVNGYFIVGNTSGE